MYSYEKLVKINDETFKVKIYEETLKKNKIKQKGIPL